MSPRHQPNTSATDPAHGTPPNGTNAAAPTHKKSPASEWRPRPALSPPACRLSPAVPCPRGVDVPPPARLFHERCDTMPSKGGVS